MLRTPYFKRASQQFLIGTRCKTPFEAVEAGIRTLGEWVRLLEEERAIEIEFVRTQNRRRHRQVRTDHATQGA